MSSRQRKRPGGALGSRPARKRSRLLPSSAGGTSQTEPIDLEESGAPAFEPEIIDLTGEDIIDLTGDDMIDLTGDDVIDLTGEDVIDLTGDNVIDLTGEDVIDLTGEDVIDLTGDNVIDLTGEDVIDLTGDEVIDLRGDDVIDLTGDEVIDLRGDDVIDLTGEDTIDLTGEDVIDLTGDDIIDLTGEDVIDLTGEDVIDLTCDDVIDLKGDDLIDLTGEDVIDLTGDEVIYLTGDNIIDLTGDDIIDLTGEEVIDLTGEDVIDLIGESSEPEVITISDDGSPVDREQSQQQPHLSRASEDSVEPLARNDEEEPIEDDDDWLRFNFERPFWSDEDSAQDREQNQQHSHLSRSTENSPGPVATRDEEEPRDSDGARPAGPASRRIRESDNSQVQYREQSQQYPLGSREAENSPEIRASDTEEETRANNDSINSDEWPDRFESPPTWRDDITDDWERSQQYSLRSRSAENSLASNLQQEPQDIEFEPLRSLVSPPDWEDDNAELPEVHGQESRNVTLNSREQVDGSGNGTGAHDAPVADPAPAEQGAAEEDTAHSDSVSSSAKQGVVIRCPICMEFYSEILQHGQQLVVTLCGHVFCSRCLPIALETAHICPTCRVEQYPEEYINIFL